MDEARKLSYSISVNSDTGQAEASLRNIVSSLGRLEDKTVKVDVSTTQAEAGIRSVTTSIGGLRTQAKDVGSAFHSSFRESYDSGSNLAASLKSGVGGALSYVGERAKTFASDTISGAQSIANSFAHPISTLQNGLSSAVDSAKSKFVDMCRGADQAADATEDLGDAADDAEKDVDDLGDSADKAGGKFEGLGKVLKGIGATVLAATGVMAALGTAAVNAGMEYESAFAQVQTIMDTSQMSTEDMSASIKELSSEMGISAADLSGTVYNAISATGDTANAVNLAGQASKLATAGFTDTSSALSVLTTAMNAYGLSADEASNISDSLIQVQNLGVTTVAELSANMGKAIASASAYGVNLTNLESAYVSITKAGINTAEGTTYISSMMKELGDTGTDVAKILKEQTGKGFDQLMAEGNSLGDVLGILSDSVDGDSTALMNLWSSAEAGKASAAIIGQGLDTFNENLIAIGDSAGATESAFNVMADTLEHKVAVFKTVGTNLLSSIYSGMSGQLGGLMDFANESMNQLASAYEEGGVPALIEAFGNVLSSGLNMLLEQLPDLIDLGMQLLGAVGQGILDNLPVLINAAGQIIVTLASGIGESLPTLIPAVVETLVSVVDTLIDNLPLLLDAGMQLIDGLAQGLIEAVPLLIEKLPTLIEGILGFISESLPTFIENGATLLMSLVTGFTEAIPLLIEQLPIIIDTFATFFTENGPMLMEQGITIITNLVMGLVEALPSLIEQVPAIISSIAGGIAENLPTIIETGVNLILELASGIISAVPQLVAQLPAIMSAIVSGFGSLMGSVADIGKAIVEGIWSGISAMGSWIKDKVSGFFGGVVDGVKGLLGIHSPSTVFAGIGDNMAAGLGQGFEKTMSGVTKEIEGSIPTTLPGPDVKMPDVNGLDLPGGKSQDLDVNPVVGAANPPTVPDVSYGVNPVVNGVDVPAVPDVSYAVNPVISAVNPPEVADVSYGVNPVIGSFNPPGYTDGNAMPGPDANAGGGNGGSVVMPDYPPPAPPEGGGGGGGEGGGSSETVFSPTVNITVEGGVDDATIERLKSEMEGSIREMFNEFKSEGLERQSLKNQYAY